MKRLKVVAWSILSQASNEVRIALEVDLSLDKSGCTLASHNLLSKFCSGF